VFLRAEDDWFGRVALVFHTKNFTDKFFNH
jgi:hypothetical protein